MNKSKKLMVISPHADDAEIGCGGYIARVVDEGGQVMVVLMTVSTIFFRHRGRVTLRERLTEFHAAMDMLGVKERRVLSEELDGKMYTSPQAEFVRHLDDLQDDFKPDTVLIPLPSSHQDHRYSWEVGVASTRPSAAKHRPNVIAAYEYPASGWGDGSEADAGKGGIYADISSYWDKKQAALECYETQMRGDHHLFSVCGIDTLARMRGLEAGFERAELFHALRIRL